MEENVSIATNATVENFDFADPWVILRAVILALLILVTIIGNSFVIAVILVERSLQSVANYLIVSLAVADLMVACLAMPLGAVYEINSRWSLGPELCDIWTSSDVLCCTASILHLVAIAVDRYWAVTDLNYIQGRSPKKIGFLIAMVWIVSLGISLAPQFGWKDPNYLERIADGECLVSQDPAYQIIATCATFYLPVCLFSFFTGGYFKQLGNVLERDQERSFNPLAKEEVSYGWQREESTAFTITRSTPDHSSISPEKSSSYNDGNVAQSAVVNVTPVTTSTTANSSNSTGQPTSSSTATTTATTGATTTATTAGVITTTTTTPATTTMTTSTSRPSSASTSTTVRQATSTKRSRETIESKREKKAAKTLAIITGAFVACWLPFFVLTLLRVICYWCQIPDVVYNVFLWLGYFNSTLNPVIYTIFSPEFRQGFKRMLCGSSK